MTIPNATAMLNAQLAPTIEYLRTQLEIVASVEVGNG